ncbi:MAG: HD-like signal output (HDOD) protein [Candidatus Endobugula sp.]|jgi:HD-like signal output (HDOD) protein
MSYNSSYGQSIANQLAAAIAAKDISVPVLPDVTYRVFSLTQSSDSDAEKLAKVIQSDPTLGGHVIRIANSAAYTPNSNLVSLQQAITRLGMIEISNIAISTSLNSRIFKAPGYEKNIAAIWHHSLVTAVWSKEIARSLRTNVEAAFLCGLLHSIGKAVILQTIADFRSSNDSIMGEYDLQKLFDEYESLIAQVVADEWGLPLIIAEAMTHYKQFNEAPTAKEIPAIVLFASQIANHMIDPELYPLETVSTSRALEVVNLYPDEVSTLLNKVETVKSSIAALST